MKKRCLIIFITLLPVILSLKSIAQTKSPLYGKWRFSAYNVDPGDGSGRWQKTADSIKQFVLFFKNGRIKGNYFGGAKTYRIEKHKRFSITSFNHKVQTYTYEVKQDTLQISPIYPYFCFEGCAYQFTKLKAN
jgi:hypothetical protein